MNMTLAIWFDQVKELPLRGLDVSWLSPLMGEVKVLKVRVLPENLQTITGLIVQCPREIEMQFGRVMRGVLDLLGGHVLIRDYSETTYRDSWDRDGPILDSLDFAILQTKLHKSEAEGQAFFDELTKKPDPLLNIVRGQPVGLEIPAN